MQSRLDRLRLLFDEAVELSANDRDAFIDSSCDGDNPMRHELSSLLDAFEESGDYFDELSRGLIVPAIQAFADFDDNDDLSDDTVISNYEIIDRIGGGGMGVVYRARDVRLGRTVALKFLPARHAADPHAQSLLLAEARAASALDHPNIGVVYQVGETDSKRPFIAMAWYDGETLKELLRRRQLSMDDIVSISRQLCSALAAAHAAGIIHRDVKPANVVITVNGTAKLVDFGIAQLVDVEHSDDGTAIGTPAYMSPEQTIGERLDARTDLWSLGVLMYEMLTGRKPFAGANDKAVITAIQAGTIQPVKALRPDTPLQLVAIVERCLRKNPSERFQTANELLRAIDGSVEHNSRQHAPSQNQEAYELFLKGRSSWNERTKPKLEEALAYFRAALEKDPDFALAHSAIAETYVNMSNFEYMPADEALTRSAVAADRAIALDASLAEAYSTRGFVLASRGKLAESEASFQKSIELNPRYSWAHHYYGLLLTMLGRIDDAIAEIRNVLALDPLSLPANATLPILFSMQRRTDDARVQYQHALALSPDFPLTRYYHGSFEAGEGRFTEATDSLERALARAPGFPGVRASLAHCYMNTGRDDDAGKLIADLQAASSTERSRVNLALGYAVLGNMDLAFEMLQNARLDVPTTIEMRANPLLAGFRSDARYAELLTKHGLPPARS